VAQCAFTRIYEQFKMLSQNIEGSVVHPISRTDEDTRDSTENDGYSVMYWYIHQNAECQQQSKMIAQQMSDAFFAHFIAGETLHTLFYLPVSESGFPQSELIHPV
jgi:hypothetical protein